MKKQNRMLKCNTVINVFLVVIVFNFTQLEISPGDGIFQFIGDNNNKVSNAII
jgi:hypothetical protein